MDPKAKKTGSPNVAEASMAYMPTPGANNVTDEISLGNKKEEQKTMAEFAEELSRNDEAKSKKVPVKTEAPKTAKPRLIDEPPVQVIDGVADDFDAPPPSHTSAGPMGEPEPKGGGRGVLIVLLLIALIATSVFAYLWWSGKSAQADLQKKNDELTATNQQLSAQSKNSSTTAPKTRSMPELKLTYSLTDTTMVVTYDYRQIVDAQKKTRDVINLSSTDVIAAEVKASPTAAPKCTADKAALGSVTVYSAEDTAPTNLAKNGEKTFADLKVDNESVYKVGESYYVYTSTQAVCSADKTVQAALTSGKAAVLEMLKSLQEMK